MLLLSPLPLMLNTYCIIERVNSLEMIVANDSRNNPLFPFTVHRQARLNCPFALSTNDHELLLTHCPKVLFMEHAA